MTEPTRPPLPTLSVLQASAMLVGIVIGIGIFKTPPLVAASAASEGQFIAFWVLGGVLMIIGALCYAELGSAYPSEGGEYHYISRAYGERLGFLFAWGRMTVMQTGAIAAVAFAYGDYANTLVPLGASGPALHAALVIILLSGLQLLGTTLSGRSQVTLTVLEVVAVLMVAVAAFLVAPASAAAPVATGSGGVTGSAGFAMILILLTYGGWNEAAYLSGEVRDVRRNMVRVLLIGASVVLFLYVLFNLSLLWAFGLDGLRQTKTVIEGTVGQAFGTSGAVIVGLVVCATAISTINVTIFTGARSMYALGRSFPPFSALGRRDDRNGAPTSALLAQAAIALALIGFGATARDGFTAMVEYTAPVFWAFLFLVAITLFLFRWRDPAYPSAFKVPLYPLTPLVFAGTCLYLLYASLAHTGIGALIGLAILAVGAPVYFLGRNQEPVPEDGMAVARAPPPRRSE